MSFKELWLLSFILLSLINFENDFAQDTKSRISLNALTLLKYNDYTPFVNVWFRNWRGQCCEWVLGPFGGGRVKSTWGNIQVKTTPLNFLKAGNYFLQEWFWVVWIFSNQNRISETIFLMCTFIKRKHNVTLNRLSCWQIYSLILRVSSSYQL